ncbi:septum site-determining protein MinC [Endozoicomonas sp. SCSIO W0465]|uniref:septum site-determining protein MinC n=1 Tax=Endozoicomonas sp. SCSIO W0465 TaxID=2918516 RepID=UPI0020762BAB|nr:septum site-determining protein MinC [Endozoicomonas sp. SCSIO W0465]USE38822.1 septum site-determining protein MinC [Endozoicomonas sp. SCSIO W0465]
MTLQLQTGTAAAAFKMTGGIYTLTTLELHSTNPVEITNQLESMTRKAPNFFQQTPVIIAFDQLGPEQPPIDLYQLRHKLQQFGLILIALRGGHENHKQDAMMAGIPWLPPPRRRNPKEEHFADHVDTNVVIMQKSRTTSTPEAETASQTQTTPVIQKTTLIEHPIRSGQQVYAEGDLVITSPVSSGAELLAGGNIHVYGPLRGRALAGVNGNTDARIFCLQFEAELISINGQYKMPSASSNGDPLWGSSVTVSLEVQSLHIKKL